MNEEDYTDSFARATPAERTATRARAALQRAVSMCARWWAEVSTPVLIYIATRFALFIVVYLSLVILPFAQDQWRGLPSNLFLDGWTRWDTGWYASIAEHGYSDIPLGSSGQSNVAFFPLYPLLLRIFNVVLHNAFVSGIVVSNLAFLLASVLLFRMVKERFGEEIAVRTVLLWSVYPFSFYFTTVYSDALFCFLIVAGFFLGERGLWWAAGLCGLLAGTTRVAGLVMLPALAMLYLEKIQFDLRKIRPDALWLGLAGLGPVFYFVYLFVRFGNPQLYFVAMQAWPWSPEGRGLPFVAGIIARIALPQAFLTGNYPVAFAFNLIITVLLFLTLIWIFRKQGLAAGTFSLVLVAVSLSQWVGMGRYALAIFPVFVAWAQMLKNRLAFESVLVMCALLLALWAIAFSHWAWVT